MQTGAKKSALSVAREVLKQESELIDRVAKELSDNKILEDVLQVMLQCKGHVLVSGAGTSRYIAERFAHLLSCCGTPALFIHPADSLHGGAGAIRKEDVLFVISKGGETEEINALVKIAKERGAHIIALTEDPLATLAHLSDFVLVVRSSGADPYGMIATGSSMVSAAIGDALCVLLLKRRGYSKENFGLTHPKGAVGKKLQSEGKKFLEEE